MKYIAFDIGDVICHTNIPNVIDNLSDTFNVSRDEATRFLKSFQQIHDLGLTTMESQLRVWFNCKSEATLKRITDQWNDLIYPEPAMIDMINGFLDKGIQVALLSNIGVEHAEMMKDKLPGIYDRAVKHFSCFVGARKPSMLYYQSFLMQYPEFKGCFYVDDLQENLDASKKFGFKTYQFSLANLHLKQEIIWEMDKKDEQT